MYPDWSPFKILNMDFLPRAMMMMMILYVPAARVFTEPAQGTCRTDAATAISCGICQ